MSAHAISPTRYNASDTNAMIRKQDLEALDSVFLALMCKKMSQDEKAAPDAREQAQKFKEEWFRLTEPETPPKNQKELDRAKKQLEDLRARMVDFLLPHVQASFAPSTEQ